MSLKNISGKGRIITDMEERKKWRIKYSHAYGRFHVSSTSNA
jgi:hypothetical protein